MPDKIKEDIINWAKSKGYNMRSNEDFSYMVVMHDEDLPEETEEMTDYKNKFNTIISRYEKNCHDISSITATALQHSLVKFISELKNKSQNLPESVRNDDYAMEYLSKALSEINEKFQLHKKRHL